MRIFLGVVAVAVAAAACTSGGANAPAGTERGACYGNGTCNEGLVCLSEVCVRPPGADCDAIATKLAGLLLGNYAPRDRRDAFLADARAQCTSLALTKEEGQCLLDARHRNGLSRCPKVIGVGDCAKIVAHLDGLKGTSGSDPFLVTAADKLASRCKNETPTLELEQCVLAATAVSQLERCAW